MRYHSDRLKMGRGGEGYYHQEEGICLPTTSMPAGVETLRGGGRSRQAQDIGVDHPPPVLARRHAEGSWAEIPLVMKSMQRLCTLETNSKFLSPKIVFNRYIASISATTTMDDNKLCLYELNSQWMRSACLDLVRPRWTCNNVGERICGWDVIESKNDNDDEFLGYIILTGDCGTAHIVAVSNNKGPQKVYSFSTGFLNAHHVAGWKDANNADLHIVLAARSGLLKGWVVGCDWKSNNSVWQGTFETKLQFMTVIQTSDGRHLISVCTLSQTAAVAAVSGNVEVLDPTRLQQAWKKGQHFLKLSDFCIWPDVGWYREYTYQRNNNRARINDSGLGNRTLRAIGNRRWAASLADGSVTVYHSNDDDSRNNFGWTQKRQVMLSYSAMNLDPIHIEQNLHLACFLRSGIVYLIPLEHNGKILVFVLPVDEEEEDSTRDGTFLQGCAAGNISMSGPVETFERVSSQHLPIFLFTGEGGMTHVFACDPLEQHFRLAEENALLYRLAENGTIQMLLDAISINESGNSEAENSEADVVSTNESGDSEVENSTEEKGVGATGDSEVDKVGDAVSTNESDDSETKEPIEEKEVDVTGDDNPVEGDGFDLERQSPREGSQAPQADHFGDVPFKEELEAIQKECEGNVTVNDILENRASQFNQTREFLLDFA